MELNSTVLIYKEILDGKRSRFPNYFFVGEQGKEILSSLTRYLIEEHLEIKIDDIPIYVNAELLWKYRLRAPAQAHGLNYIDLIQLAYPDQFYPWEFKQVSFGYWKGEQGRQKAIETVKYVIETKCEIQRHLVPKNVNHNFFKKHRLLGIFKIFGDSPFLVINAVYPDQFQLWEFSNVPINSWKNEENIKKILEWLFFEKLQFASYREAMDKLKIKHFSQYQLTGFYQMAFDQRLFKVKEWINNQINNGLE